MLGLSGSVESIIYNDLKEYFRSSEMHNEYDYIQYEPKYAEVKVYIYINIYI